MSVEESLTLRRKYNTSEKERIKNNSEDSEDIPVIDQHISNALGSAQSDNAMAISICDPVVHRGKEWYINIKIIFPDGSYVNKKFTRGFLKYNNEIEKEQFAKLEMARFSDKISNGWNPLEIKRKTAQVSHLQYQHKAEISTQNTVPYFIELFLEDKKIHKRDKTYRTYQSKFRYIYKWLQKNNLQHKVITMLTKDIAKAFVADLKTGLVTKTTPCNRTVREYISLMHNLWQWFENKYEEIPVINIWKKVERPKATVGRSKTYTKEEVEKIFEHLKEKGEIQLLIICKLIYKVFLRPGREISGLLISDIDTTENKIWVRAEISKNKKTQFVPLPSDVKNMLDLNHPANYFLFGKSGPEQTKVGRDYWSKKFTKIVRELNIPPGLTIYNLKHTGNKVAHLNGMPLKKLKELNRHSSLEVLDNYLSGIMQIETEELEKYFK